MIWRCVILVPQEHVIEYARDVPTAQAGAEAIRARSPTVKSGSHVYYPSVAEISGPPIPIEAYADMVRPKEPAVPELTLKPEPPSGPSAA